MKNGNSIGRTGKHSMFCEGHVSCPVTGKEECRREMVSAIYTNGQCGCVTVFCFGCGETHNVKEAQK